MNDDLGLSPEVAALVHAWVMAAVPEPLPDWAADYLDALAAWPTAVDGPWCEGA